MHNRTSMEKPFDINLVTVGNATYGGLNIINHSDHYKLEIGHYCSIGPDVLFVVCGDHRSDTISTFPYGVRYFGKKHEAISKGDIIIADDVWIGTRATILSGVTVGQGSIITAGAVVIKDVPPYSIVGGVPAKVIKKRFNEEEIEKLLTIDYGRITPDVIRENEKVLSDKYTLNTSIGNLPVRSNN